MKTGVFAGQVGIVTGAGQGIGYEIAHQLCQQGASIILNDSASGLCAEAAGRIAEQGGSCLPFAGDAGDPEYCTAVVAEAVRAFGRLDLAVANAGITLFGDFLTYPAADLQAIFRLNLGGTFFLAQAAARQMHIQGDGGSLLFMSSVTGIQAHAQLVPYGMTKAGIQMLAKGLVAELSPLGINVNAIAPGATATERTLEDPTYQQTWAKITPMGRPGTVADVAQAALFLLSPQARHITGQTLVVDGGWSAVSPSPYTN